MKPVKIPQKIRPLPPGADYIGVQNKYPSIQIWEFEWMIKSLSTTVFRNGDPIPEANSHTAWRLAYRKNKPAWCYLNFDRGNERKFGRLYNWHAVNDSRGLAPRGWRIPTYEDWSILKYDLNDRFTIRGFTKAKKLKLLEFYLGQEHGGNEGFIPFMTFFWSSTEANERNAHAFIMGTDYYYYDYEVVNMEIPKRCGLYVRCVRNSRPF